MAPLPDDYARHGRGNAAAPVRESALVAVAVAAPAAGPRGAACATYGLDLPEMRSGVGAVRPDVLHIGVYAARTRTAER